MTFTISRMLAFAALLSFGTQTVSADSLPPLFHNLSATPGDAYLDDALETRLRKTYPSDIRSSTLRALFELEGFEIDDTDDKISASIVEAEYPCMTRYIVKWVEAESGKVEDLSAEMTQKCV